MPMKKESSVNRRGFLKSAAVTGAAALVGGAAPAAAGQQPAASGPASAPIAPREEDPSGEVDVLTTDRPGGDFMVDVIKSLGAYLGITGSNRCEACAPPQWTVWLVTSALDW